MTTKTTAAAMLLSAIPATAGTTAPYLTTSQPVSTTAPAWHWRVGLDVWAQALTGDTMVRGRNVELDLGIDDTLGNLELAAMGVVEVGYGRWSLVADLNYAELSSSRGTARTYSTIDLSQFIGNFALSCNLIDNGATRFDVYAGARVNSLEMDLNMTVAKIRNIPLSGSKTWTDPIIGVRFQQNLSEKFFFRAVADLGGFGVSSDFTWQALAMLGYRINDCASVVLGYRGIGTDYQDGQFGYDATNHGPLLGFEYKF
jgi:hypothetical protein